MSSYFDEASLVMIPSGYKDQKVYSVKPLDGSGDLTFSRASSATRVASNGLIEKVRTNLVLQSQAFNTTWGADAGGGTGSVTVTANYAAAPDGTMTADRVQLTRGTQYINISQSISVTAGQKYTASVYLKSLSGTPSVSFLYDSVPYSATLTSDWVRVEITYTASGSSTAPLLGLFGGNSATADFLAWGYQLEASDFGATPYIATTSAAVSVGPVSGLPRLDYLNSTCPRLLLEPQRTNLITYSEQFNNAVWAATRASFTANQTTAPDGYTGADLYTDGTFTGNVSFVEQAVVVGGSGTTYSVFVKKGTANFIQFGFYDTDFHGFVVNTTTWATTHTFGSASLFTATNYGNGWYRLSMYKAAASNTIYASVAVCGNSTGANYNGTGSLTAYFWGAQIEGSNSAYATSYIPTLGTSVTRVAEDLEKASVNSLIGGTSGTIFFEIKTNKTLTNALYKQFFYYQDASSAQAYMYLASNNLIVTNPPLGSITSSIALQADTTYKVAIAYAPNDFKLYINGVERGSSTSGTPINAVNILSIGSYQGSSEFNEMSFAQYLHFKTRLSNSDLATLTTL